MRFHGLHGSAVAWQLASTLTEHESALILVKDRRTAAKLLEELKFFHPSPDRVVEFPAWEALPFEHVSPSADVSGARLTLLLRLAASEPLHVIASPQAFMQAVLPRPVLAESTLTLTKGDSVDREELVLRLEQLGYRLVSLVEQPGEAAVQGGVIDVFSPPFQNPLRFEFLSDLLQDVRSFEASSQRSVSDHESAMISRVSERLTPDELQMITGQDEDSLRARMKKRAQALETPPSESKALITDFFHGYETAAPELLQHILLPGPPVSLFDHLPRDLPVMLIDEVGSWNAIDDYWELIGERAERLKGEHYLIPEAAQLYFSPGDLREKTEGRIEAALNELEILKGDHQSKKIVALRNTELSQKLRSGTAGKAYLEPLRDQIAKWRRKNFRVCFVLGSEHRANRLVRLLLDLDIQSRFDRDRDGYWWWSNPNRSPIQILLGHLHSGIQLPDEKLVFVAENEIFGERSYRRTKRAEGDIRKLLTSLSRLQIGDFVVHQDYGVGRYQGFVHREVEGKGSDLLQIEYADSTLYLPMTNIGKIQRFSALEGQEPSIDKLSSNRWQKTKQKVRAAVVTLAGDLMKLYAARSVARGWPFDPAGAEDERFADDFPFNETDDQLQAIEETLSDMAREKPMDRLICGDVGFGKTEVALRAAYKAIQHRKQVALLAPTTILVEQHRQTFESRFRGFPVEVAAVSRFYRPKQNAETLERVSSGKLDVVIGTHRLIQRDVKFSDLGLLIIDEEHRFGVRQKERIKQLKKQVDVLTLTATPIPRTLHMSLLNLRDISIISTPPTDRRTVRTYVSLGEETLIRDAILRELQRGGQCFFVHNRVKSIAVITEQLRELIPEARVEFAHGQMKESELEKIMLRFVNHEMDVLVSTTIIESGLDIPNANTMLIDRADTFGLAQLYQLRGRVGRSSRQAYCYFLVPKRKNLSYEAQQRLKALQALDDLGMGFQLAIRDLEIRGAGNLLGKEQSGHVLSVGFEMYSKILKEAIANLSGDALELEELIEPEVKIDLNAFIPEYYIPDLRERMILYQRLGDLRREEDALDLRTEIEDRFGSHPEEVENLILLMTFRGQLKEFGVERADFGPGRILLSLSEHAPLSPQKVIRMTERRPKSFKFEKGTVIRITSEDLFEKEIPHNFRAVLELLQMLKEEETSQEAERTA